MSRAVPLLDRIDALERIASIDHLDPEASAGVDRLLEKARGRVRHGTDVAVVALAGSTGVGKSSLFNALAGTTVSEVGVRRPTTGVAHAAVWASDDGGSTDELLDWLQVARRHHLTEARPAGGLVLLDLPDFDSTAVAHRVEVDRLVDLVDALIWVTDPQKYADEALHHGYVRPLAAHGEVMHFVLNKIDTVPSDERAAVVADLERRLRDDGLDDPRVVVAATLDDDDGNDVSAVVDVVDDIVAGRRASTDRLVADMRRLADTLSSSGSIERLHGGARRELVDRLGRAAGADAAGAIVAAQHRKDARMAMGWPPVRIVERFRRRHPISELPRVTVDGVARTEIDLALREAAESVAGDAAPPWPQALRATAAAHADHLATDLTAVTRQSATVATARPAWWVPVGALQRLLALVALAGLLWLLVAAVLGGFFRLDTDPLLIDTPGLEWIPLPSLLVLGGLLAGLIVAGLVRVPVAMAARRRGASVRRRMLGRVETLVDDTVGADLDRVVADHAALRDDLDVLGAP